jgi:hypothetical protein
MLNCEEFKLILFIQKIKKSITKKLSSTDFELTFYFFIFFNNRSSSLQNPLILCYFQICLITSLEYWKSQKVSSKSVELNFFGAGFFRYFQKNDRLKYVKNGNKEWKYGSKNKNICYFVNIWGVFKKIQSGFL